MIKRHLYRCAATALFAASILTLTACSSTPGLIQREADAQRSHIAAAKLIESLGGSVHANNQGAVVTIQNTDKDATKQSLDALHHITDLHSLYLSSIDPANLKFKSLEELYTLQSITITNIPLTNKDIASLLENAYLRGVHLYKTGLTDIQLDAIAALPYLRDITLGYAAVSDSGLASLQSAQGLRNVRFVKSSVSLLAAQALCDTNDWLVVDYDGTRLRGYRATE